MNVLLFMCLMFIWLGSLIEIEIFLFLKEMPKPIHNQQQRTPNNKQIKTITKIRKIITNYIHTKSLAYRINMLYTNASNLQNGSFDIDF